METRSFITFKFLRDLNLFTKIPKLVIRIANCSQQKAPCYFCLFVCLFYVRASDFAVYLRLDNVSLGVSIMTYKSKPRLWAIGEVILLSPSIIWWQKFFLTLAGFELDTFQFRVVCFNPSARAQTLFSINTVLPDWTIFSIFGLLLKSMGIIFS